MGAKMGNLIVCLTMCYIEERLFVQFDGTCHILYKRYMVRAAKGPICEIHNFIKYVCNFYLSLKFTHGNFNPLVTVLDLKFCVNNCKIFCDI